ncbi:hypothetical protein [Methylobacterium nigriterrae]|uniref:hypothetical protein n=1 Tax=Methylobacterium nigriterrae TaxID=3127512 RepID=UPI00301355EA
MAQSAGIDYWAYGWYGLESPVNAWKLHQSSKHANLVKWCFIFFSYRSFSSEIGKHIDQYVQLFRSDNYQKVLGGRPILYLMDDHTPPAELLAPITNVGVRLQALASPPPYIVLMTGLASGTVALAGADAVGRYTSQGTGGSYADLAKTVETYWNKQAATGQSVVPTAMTGWDRRPRVSRPVPWEASSPTSAAPCKTCDFYTAGTPEQIAEHISRMLAWIDTHRHSALAQTGLIYSWDEHDEGGSTLNPSVSDGNAIIDATSKVLRRNKY